MDQKLSQHSPWVKDCLDVYKSITINIRQEPELCDALLTAMNSGTDYEGWYVMQFSEHSGLEWQLVGEFMLSKKEAGGQMAAVKTP